MGEVSRDDERERPDRERVAGGRSTAPPGRGRQALKQCHRCRPHGAELIEVTGPRPSAVTGRLGGDILIESRQRRLQAAGEPPRAEAKTRSASEM